MRILLIISFIVLSFYSYEQDTIHFDTANVEYSSELLDNSLIDSIVSEAPLVPKNKKKKKVLSIQREQLTSISKTNEKVVTSGYTDNKKNLIEIVLFITVLVFLIFLIFVSVNLKYFSKKIFDDGQISDYFQRRLMSRRDYYINVYLKSEAWQRKRYVVLKRDKWRCVYCGSPASEVHHTRYAKINIGKEPIEWLVSVCRTCHSTIHE